MDLEALNRYVLIAIGLFAVLLYVSLLYAGLTEFRARISQKALPERGAARGLPKTKMPI
jgi:hypothetical protein